LNASESVTKSEGVIQDIVGLLVEFVNTSEGDVRVRVAPDDIGVLAEARHEIVGEQAGEGGVEPTTALQVVLNIDLLGCGQCRPDWCEEVRSRRVENQIREAAMRVMKRVMSRLPMYSRMGSVCALSRVGRVAKVQSEIMTVRNVEAAPIIPP